MHFIRRRGGEEVFQLVKLQRVVGASPGGVDQDEIAIVHRRDRIAQIFGIADDPQGRADNVGVFLQLIDRGDAVRVDRDQTDLPFLAELQVRRELGDRGGLAHAGRADQRDDVWAGGFLSYDL